MMRRCSQQTMCDWVTCAGQMRTAVQNICVTSLLMIYVQVICVIVADSEPAARRGARAVKLTKTPK
jgi:xanthine dehydrogenase molybdopterin-binding subunit B